MRRVIIGLAMAFSIVGRADAAIQWSMSNGGNDHWYELVMSNLNWDQSRAAAESASHLGMFGHLVTVTSLEEHQFLEQSFALELNSPFNYPADILWIGLTDRDDEGVFRWITGEPVTFTAWLPGEPNNSLAGWNPDGEDVVHYQRIGNQASLGWNDHPGVPDPGMSGPPAGARWGYITEFEPAVVPEPAALAVWSVLGVIGIGVTYRRRRMLKK